MASKRSRAAFESDLQKQESPYVFYGKPLPPLDDHTRDDGAYVPVWKQEVTDDRGRKRLHGAFTGGFSAGYFNTVGSKEGWTPSAFVSSRTKKANDGESSRQQRPEDFMDEEDIREAEEAKKLSTADEFAGFGSTDEDKKRRETVIDLFRPNGETVGVKLLKRMGWKEGQGLGPKVRRSAEGDESAETHLFAPEDPKMVAFVKKTDIKGLGYQSEAQLQREDSITAPGGRSLADAAESDDEDGVGPRLAVKRPSKSGKSHTKKGGIGIGILNDDGSDDDDPYSMGPKISYNRTIGTDKKLKKPQKSLLRAPNPLLKSNPVFRSQKKISKADLRKCHDGRLPPDGFRLADQVHALSTLSLHDDPHKPPDVPADWVSSKASNTRDAERPISQYVSTVDAAKASNMDAKSRASLLGESLLPGKSVFDYISPQARDRLAAASGKTNLPVAKGEKAPAGHEINEQETKQKLESSIPKLDKDTALQALSRGLTGWMPYSEDEGKRRRYRTFLEVQAGMRDSALEKSTDLTNGAWMAELNEFASAAQVFRPVSGTMASRFTSSSTSGTNVPSDLVETDPSAGSLLTRPAKPTDPAEEAAKIGMFGPMTRSVENFYPTRLLCKRFNVKPPANMVVDPGEGGNRDVSGTSTTSGGSKFESAGFQMNPEQHLLVLQEGLHSSLTASGEKETSLGHEQAPAPVEIDAERNEALEGDRPGETVFKAIFGSDDEDE